MVAPGKVILLIEDEPSIQSLIATALRDEGFVVMTAGLGQEAMHWATQVRPHLVLLDLMLPDMEAQDLGARLRFRYGPTVPVIIVSAAGPQIIGQVADELGAFETLAKPFELEVLLAAVNRGLAEEERRSREQDADS